MKIRKMENTGEIKECFLDQIKNGDLVESYFNQYKEVMTISKHFGFYSTIILFLENGNYLKMTKDHKLIIFNNNETSLKNAGDCNIGDIIKLRNNTYNKVIEKQIGYSDCLVNIRTEEDTLIIKNTLCSIYVKGDMGVLGNLILKYSYKINKYLPQIIQNISNNIGELIGG